jgi:hypothetical protein
MALDYSTALIVTIAPEDSTFKELMARIAHIEKMMEIMVRNECGGKIFYDAKNENYEPYYSKAITIEELKGLFGEQPEEKVLDATIKVGGSHSANNSSFVLKI